MTKDDLPPLPPIEKVNFTLPYVYTDRQMTDYALAAIAAHDAKRMDTCHPYWETASREELLDTLKFQGAITRAMLESEANREKVLLWRWTNKLGGWNQASPSEVDGKRIGDCEYAWAYIEREGA